MRLNLLNLKAWKARKMSHTSFPFFDLMERCIKASLIASWLLVNSWSIHTTWERSFPKRFLVAIIDWVKADILCSHFQVTQEATSAVLPWSGKHEDCFGVGCCDAGQVTPAKDYGWDKHLLKSNHSQAILVYCNVDVFELPLSFD